MVDLAVPVVVGGKHAATLLGGQVFREKPTRRRFDRVARLLRKCGMRIRLDKIRKSYFGTPVLSEKQLQGAVQLLTILAAQIAESANRYLLAARRPEPTSVTQAKAFVRAHASEKVTLPQTTSHVHVSRHHFCKVFKQATGITFTEFVAHVRVEKAKALLGDRQLRITDVASRAGFNSISQFNRVFRRYTGDAPTAYRAKWLGQVGPS